jgi:chloramphenicol-sensitive protein RarD
METQEEHAARVRSGLLFGLAAHACWGCMPLYFSHLRGVGPFEQLTHRIVWSAVLLAALLTYLRKWRELGKALSDRTTLLMLGASTAFISANWFIFLYAVNTGQTLQSSLGYFINPLFNVALGVLFLGERLRRLQWAALGVAACGLVYLMWVQWQAPWIALGVASSFAFYGLIRKLAPVDGLVGLTAETLILAPAATFFLGLWMVRGEAGFLTQGTMADVLLLLSGVATVVPLWFFVMAARRLHLSTLGFLQYVGPSLQFLTAIFLLKETVRMEQLVAFGFVWLALVIVTIDSLRARELTPPEAPRPPETGPAGQEGPRTAVVATRP